LSADLPKLALVSPAAFEPRPSLYTILQMHTLPRVGGDTLWASNYAAYDRLTPAYQRFLEGLTALHDAERFRVQARLNGFKLRTEPRGSPLNQGDAFQASHPIIRCVLLSSLSSPSSRLPLLPSRARLPLLKLG